MLDVDESDRIIYRAAVGDHGFKFVEQIICIAHAELDVVVEQI